MEGNQVTEDISMTMCKLITTEDQGRSRASAVQISTERDDRTDRRIARSDFSVKPLATLPVTSQTEESAVASCN